MQRNRKKRQNGFQRQRKCKFVVLIGSLFLMLGIGQVFAQANKQTLKEYLAQGEAAFTAYDLSLAERNYLLALRVDSNSKAAYESLVRIYQAQKRYADGIAMADQALKVFPSDASLWVSKGLLFRDSGDMPKANAAYMQAVKLSENDPEILLLAEHHFYSVGNHIYARELGVQRKQLESRGTE